MEQLDGQERPRVPCAVHVDSKGRRVEPQPKVTQRTGAEKLLGLSEPAPQIPDRGIRHLWLWFDPSALGVNVDRTQDTRAFPTVKLLRFYHTSTAPTSPRTRVPPLRARPAGPTGGYVS